MDCPLSVFSNVYIIYIIIIGFVYCTFLDVILVIIYLQNLFVTVVHVIIMEHVSQPVQPTLHVVVILVILA